MIDLEARAHTLNQEAVTPRLAVDVVLERARRIRKRRRLVVVAFCCSLIVAGAVAVTLRLSRASNSAVVVSPSTGSRRATKPTVPAPALVAVPGQAIVHGLGGADRPGRVEVVDTKTGRTLRVLGADYDPYLQNGFAIARSSGLALWTRLNQPAQTLELVEVPIAGGEEHVIGSTNPLGSGAVSPGPLLTAVSPDGRQLWMNGDKIVDLGTGHQVNVPQPPFAVGARWGGATWLPDGHHLFVIELQAVSNCDRSSPLGGVPPACETTTTAGACGSHGWTYDLDDPAAGWRGGSNAASHRRMVRPADPRPRTAAGNGRRGSAQRVVEERRPTAHDDHDR